jgi:hypothetical protein
MLLVFVFRICPGDTIVGTITRTINEDVPWSPGKDLEVDNARVKDETIADVETAQNNKEVTISCKKKGSTKFIVVIRTPVGGRMTQTYTLECKCPPKNSVSSTSTVFIDGRPVFQQCPCGCHDQGGGG